MAIRTKIGPNVLYWILLCSLGAAGLVQTFTQYPFQAPDERTHWLAGVQRTYAWLPGGVQAGARLSALPDHFGFGRISRQRDQKNTPGSFEQSLSLSGVEVDPKLNYGFFLSYPGVTAAILLSKIFPLSDLTTFYLARFFQGLLVLAAMGALLGVILKSANPETGKRTCWILASFLFLSPIGLQQSFAVSADTLTFLFALYVVYSLWKLEFTKLDALVLLAIGISATITKPPLLVSLVGLGVWLQFNRSLSKSQTACLWGVVGSVVVVTALASWLSVSKTVPLDRASPGAQITFLLGDPLAGLLYLWKGIWAEAARPRNLSLLLGALDFNPTSSALVLQRVYQSAVLGLFLLTLLASRKRLVYQGLSLPVAKQVCADVLFLSSILVGLLLIAFFLALFWTSPRAPSLDGMQARYYIPAYLFFLGWLGARWDSMILVRGKLSVVQGELFEAVAYLWVVGGLVTYVFERGFSNLVRYF